VNDLKRRALFLSMHVATVFGLESTTFVESTTLEDRVQSAVSRLMAEHPTQEVSLGTMIKRRLGVCRHRSILFKYLCDHMHRFPAQWGLTSVASAASATDAPGLVRGAIPCQVVRGVLLVTQGNEVTKGVRAHMWNVVRIGSKSFIVDAMQCPGHLFSADSLKARAYQRLILGFGDEARAQVINTAGLCC
jgi:hypothetical protein